MRSNETLVVMHTMTTHDLPAPLHMTYPLPYGHTSVRVRKQKGASCGVRWPCHSNKTGRNFTCFLTIAGQACYSNGSLAVLDTSTLRLSCDFPYRQLAAFQSLASLSIGFFCRPRSYVSHPTCDGIRSGHKDTLSARIWCS